MRFDRRHYRTKVHPSNSVTLAHNYRDGWVPGSVAGVLIAWHGKWIYGSCQHPRVLGLKFTKVWRAERNNAIDLYLG